MIDESFIYVLGTTQDGGFPHSGCNKKCCNHAWETNIFKRYPSSLALINKKINKFWLFDITPSFKNQLQLIQKFDCELSGIFITHAHYGHYIGILELGLEVMNSKNIPIYVMPEMYDFIKSNKPTNLLIDNNNIILNKIHNNDSLLLDDFTISPFLVNHRNEMSETVGYVIKKNDVSIVYLPDIDSWYGFEDEIKKLVKSSKVCFVDGTFYNKTELGIEKFNKVPHPEVLNSMQLFSTLSYKDRKKINFIHYNHTNPLINLNSPESKEVLNNGYSLSFEKQIVNF